MKNVFHGTFWCTDGSPMLFNRVFAIFSPLALTWWMMYSFRSQADSYQSVPEALKLIREAFLIDYMGLPPCQKLLLDMT